MPFYSAQYDDLLSRLRPHASTLGRELRHFIDYNNWEEEIRLVGRLLNERYEAIIVAPTLDESKTAGFYARLTPQGTYVTLIDHTMAGSYFSYVIQSYDLGVKRGMRYLLDRTPRGIAFVRNETWTGRNLVEELMYETYSQIMAAQRPDARPVTVDRPVSLDAAFCDSHGIGAFFCCDDTDAVRVIGHLKEQGLEVGRDFALVSYGNTALACHFTPGITSIDPRNQEMADCTASILKRHLDGKSTALCQYVVQPRLVERGT
jgi:DNA-binding LacI/PurR family transcriptional regulator